MVGAMLLLLVAVWNAPPASLGEAALREAVRRQRMPPSTQVVTNESLGPMPPAPPTSPSEPPVVADATVPAAGGDAPPGQAEGVVKDAAWWRARMTTAREAVARDRVLAAALDSRIAALTSDIVGRDDPAQRAQLMAARQQAVDELDRLSKQIDAGVLAITAIEDEARKAGVPPGWIRG